MLSKSDEILLNILLWAAVIALVIVIVFVVYLIGGAVGFWPLAEVLMKR